MREYDSKRWVLALAVGIVLVFTAMATAQFLPIYGGPTYNSSTGSGYQNPYMPYPGSSSGSGFGVANETKYITFRDKFQRAVRWDSSGTIIEFGNLGTNSDGDTSVIVCDTSSFGISVGTVDKYVDGNRNGSRAVRWDASGVPTELEHLGGFINGIGDSIAFAVNNTGTTVGSTNAIVAGVYKGSRAVRWDASGAAGTELGNLGTDANGFAASFAWKINEVGTAAGNAVKYVAGVEIGARAVRWDATGTTATELGILGNNAGAYTEASDINDIGTIVGHASRYPWSDVPTEIAVRWNGSGTVAIELGNLGSAGTTEFSRALDVNNVGTAVGFSQKYIAGESKGQRAVRWDASSAVATELGNFGVDASGYTQSVAEAINESGMAVGYAYNLGNDMDQRAVLWGPDGTAIDLNTLIDPASGWVLLTASDISNDFWITGIGVFDPDGTGGLDAYARLFLLQVPEPTSILPLWVGVMTLLARRRFLAK